MEQPYNDKNLAFPCTALESLLKTYGVTTKQSHDMPLYQTAFVHRSYCTRKNDSVIAGNANCPPNVMHLQGHSYERLEHLGDSVVGLIVASYLYERYPSQDEGFLTRMKVKLVNGVAMASMFKYLDLQKYIVISAQIEAAGGRASDKIHEDVFESFIGALYLDIGFIACREWLVAFYEENIDFADLVVLNSNYKDILIKHCQNELNFSPRFLEMSMTKGNFTVCIKDDKNSIMARGHGTTKKMAENDSAKAALISMGHAL